MSALNEDQFSYRIAHRPPEPWHVEDGTAAPMHEIQNVMPDFHSHPQWYKSGNEFDHESVKPILAAKGKPDHEVTVYRGVGPEVKDNTIHPGDWVTPSKSYARSESLHPTDASKDGRVLSMKVRAKELLTHGDSLHEWGYRPA